MDPNAVPADSSLLGSAPVSDATGTGDLAANEAENPYGLAQLWAQGDFVARGTLIILAPGESRTYDLAIDILHEPDAIRDFLAAFK